MPSASGKNLSSQATRNPLIWIEPAGEELDAGWGPNKQLAETSKRYFSGGVRKEEPMTKKKVRCGGDAEQVRLYAQLFHFFVVILAVEDGPLLGAFDDGFALAFNLEAGSLVDAGFLHEKVFKNFANFEANGVAVLDEVNFIQVSHSIGDGVGEFVNLVATQSQSGGILRERPYIF